MNYQLSDDQWDELTEQARAGHVGADSEWECNYGEGDHFHTKRVGEQGSDIARGAVMVHAGMNVATVFFAAPQLRQIAAQLLNIADEIDGTVPLSFVEGAPSAEG